MHEAIELLYKRMGMGIVRRPTSPLLTRSSPRGVPKMCFTIARIDARKCGLSRVWLGKRMCLMARAK
jgi:hypothetical protein